MAEVKPLKYFSTFSGIGGFELGIQNAYRNQSLSEVEQDRQGRDRLTDEVEQMFTLDTSPHFVLVTPKSTNTPHQFTNITSQEQRTMETLQKSTPKNSPQEKNTNEEERVQTKDSHNFLHKAPHVAQASENSILSETES